MNKVSFHPQAAVELNEAALYLEEQSPGLGSDFLDTAESSVKLITIFPFAWTEVRSNIRRMIMPRFLYCIFYRLQPDGTIEILAVMHPHRDPFTFMNRV